MIHFYSPIHSLKLSKKDGIMVLCQSRKALRIYFTQGDQTTIDQNYYILSTFLDYLC